MKGDFFGIYSRFTILINNERQELWFLCLFRKIKIQWKARKWNLISQEIAGTRLDKRSQAMFGLCRYPFRWEQMMLFWFAWLGYNLSFLENKDRYEVLCPIRNRVDRLKSHVWASYAEVEGKGPWGECPPRDFRHLVGVVGAELQQSFSLFLSLDFLKFICLWVFSVSGSVWGSLLFIGFWWA